MYGWMNCDDKDAVILVVMLCVVVDIWSRFVCLYYVVMVLVVVMVVIVIVDGGCLIVDVLIMYWFCQKNPKCIYTELIVIIIICNMPNVNTIQISS